MLVGEHLPVCVLDLCRHILHLFTNAGVIEVVDLNLCDGDQIWHLARATPCGEAHEAAGPHGRRRSDLETLIPSEAWRLLQEALDRIRLDTDLDGRGVQGVAEINVFSIHRRNVPLEVQLFGAVVRDERHRRLPRRAAGGKHGAEAVKLRPPAREREALLLHASTPALRLNHRCLIVHGGHVLVDVPKGETLVIRGLADVLLAAKADLKDDLKVVRQHAPLVPRKARQARHTGVDQQPVPLEERGTAHDPVVEQAAVLERRGERVVWQLGLLGIILATPPLRRRGRSQSCAGGEQTTNDCHAQVPR
mmetsp:Transcript_71468/g.180680  ORF Transcript_71468/g.180680 Transcript_71468/m.180680 type:complete len:306 (+) Transcript_71468:657-1574(+)